MLDSNYLWLGSISAQHTVFRFTQRIRLWSVWLFDSIPIQDMLDAMRFILGVEAGVLLMVISL
jgi:hypothetical protein